MQRPRLNRSLQVLIAAAIAGTGGALIAAGRAQPTRSGPIRATFNHGKCVGMAAAMSRVSSDQDGPILYRVWEDGHIEVSFPPNLRPTVQPLPRRWESLEDQ
jgi:hypothetical protein